MKVLGLDQLSLACTIRAYGMGPVVNPSVSTINWGKIQIMEEVEKRFELINVSPIPAYYKINMVY